MSQENTIPKLTQKDFEDPTLYRVNAIIGDMVERIASASLTNASITSPQVLTPDATGAVVATVNSDPVTMEIRIGYTS